MRLAHIGPAAKSLSLSGWTVLSGGRQFGPLSEEELRRFFSSGIVKDGDILVHRDFEGGLPARELAQRLMLAAPVATTEAASYSEDPPVRLLSMAPHIPSGRRAGLLALLALGLLFFLWLVPEPQVALHYARGLMEQMRAR
jgi:hypothetical protein